MEKLAALSGARQRAMTALSGARQRAMTALSGARQRAKSGWWPDRVLVGLVLVSFWGLFVFTAQSGNAFTTYLIPLVLIAALRQLREPLTTLWRDPLYRCFLLLLVYLGASAAWSADATFIEFLKAQTRVLFIVGYVTAVIILTWRFPQFVGWMVVGVVVAAASSTLLAAGSLHTEEGRLIGHGDLDRAVVAGISWGGASVLAIALVGGGAPFAWRESRWAQAGFAVAALATFAAMLWSGSRTAWLAFAAAILCLGFAMRGRQRVLWLSTCLVAITLVAAIALDTSTQAWVLPRGGSFRPAIWSSTVDAIVHGNWLFGHGMLSRYVFFTDGYRIAHPHSVYLATLYHGGVIAASLLVVLLAWALVRASRLRGGWEGRLASTLLVFAVVAMVPDGNELIDKVGYLWLLVWTPLAWAMALRPATSPQDLANIVVAPDEARSSMSSAGPASDNRTTPRDGSEVRVTR